MGLFGNMPERIDVAGVALRCQICRHDLFWEREAQLNTMFFTLLDIDWLNRVATCYVCDGCGYVHWFLRKDTEPAR